jgi:hypothetical protein
VDDSPTGARGWRSAPPLDRHIERKEMGGKDIREVFPASSARFLRLCDSTLQRFQRGVLEGLADLHMDVPCPQCFQVQDQPDRKPGRRGARRFEQKFDIRILAVLATRQGTEDSHTRGTGTAAVGLSSCWNAVGWSPQ